MKLHFQSFYFRVLLSPELFCVENAVFFICENYHDLNFQKSILSILFLECVIINVWKIIIILIRIDLIRNFKLTWNRFASRKSCHTTARRQNTEYLTDLNVGKIWKTLLNLWIFYARVQTCVMWKNCWFKQASKDKIGTAVFH